MGAARGKDVQARADRASRYASARLSAWLGRRVELAVATVCVGVPAILAARLRRATRIDGPVTGVRQGFRAGARGEALMLLAGDPADRWWRPAGALSGQVTAGLTPDEALLELGALLTGVYVGAAGHDGIGSGVPCFLPPTLLGAARPLEVILTRAAPSRAALRMTGMRVSVPAIAFDGVLVIFSALECGNGSPTDDVPVDARKAARPRGPGHAMPECVR
ncbi:hypothetical protein [Paraburkholderia kururiensis]|uniref:hypothetical protein n=1 Tax=Paraburkholderia kururiensis TaxID=984307 RepID=UPI0018F2A375|nr:hypothetical protein [Paraburkholderia kururiensis]